MEERMKLRSIAVFVIIILSFAFFACESCERIKTPELRFKISFPSSDAKAKTGRIFIIISKSDKREPRLQIGSWDSGAAFFAVDVENLKPGEVAVIDDNVLGYPPKSLSEIPKGDYYIQGLFNIYTEFHRSDGHVIWAHMDQWEGQKFNISPGNLYGDVQPVQLDPSAGYTIDVSLNKMIPPVEVPADNEYVKNIKIQSKLLTEFWGHPIELGAVVILPKGYETHPNVHYPIHYHQGHFSLSPMYNFSEHKEFYNAWTSEDFPRLIGVTFQHPCPYYDDSYAVNSANCGPYGDAIMTELIPYIEEHFRVIRKPYARVLSGGSTGGWEALALQLFHPDFFGGAWIFCPDPIDFRYYGLININEDNNAFYKEYEWIKVERPSIRDIHGQDLQTVRQMSQMEAVLGSKGRSGDQLDIWQAVYGPVGEDGYPKPIWNKSTGEIDNEVAQYFKEHYDLRYYTEKNWSWLGPKLEGKLHFLTGDMDSYYLNEAVYEFEKFLENTKNPHDGGSFQYGRPREGHGWNPYGWFTGKHERVMAEYIIKIAPKGEDTKQWKYR